MNLIGDLERLFATNLYPNRVPIAIGALLVGVLLLLLARHRGWFDSARRHPARTAAVVVIALAIGLPSAWYLGSPLFIRTALNEPGPTVGPTASPIVTATPDAGVVESATPGTPNDPPTAAPTATQLATPRSGTFTGADDFHFGSGTATLIETTPGAWTIRFDNFSVRNGPDLYVYVSTDAAGYGNGALEVGKLRATDGNFNMDLPAGVVPDGAASIVIWCKQFAVQFAVASLAG